MRALQSKQIGVRSKLRDNAIHPQLDISSKLGRSTIKRRTRIFDVAILGEVESDDKGLVPACLRKLRLHIFYITMTIWVPIDPVAIALLSKR